MGGVEMGAYDAFVFQKRDTTSAGPLIDLYLSSLGEIYV